MKHLIRKLKALFPFSEQTSDEVERTRQFSLEVIDLLKHSPQCRMPFNKFIPSYHHHFGKQCRVSDYGFTKLIELFESIPNILQVGDLISKDMNIYRCERHTAYSFCMQNECHRVHVISVLSWSQMSWHKFLFRIWWLVIQLYQCWLNQYIDIPVAYQCTVPAANSCRSSCVHTLLKFKENCDKIQSFNALSQLCSVVARLRTVVFFTVINLQMAQNMHCKRDHSHPIPHSLYIMLLQYTVVCGFCGSPE